MRILGITGGTGSGKTTLLRAVERMGGFGIDCDVLYHRLLRTDGQMLAAIDARFPNVVQNGVLNRKQLGNLVFKDPIALQELSALTHAFVSAEVRRLLAQSCAPFIAIDAIGLFESGLARLCDVTVAVTAPEEHRVERLMRRDDISREYALSRIRAQKSDAEFSALTDYTLRASGETPEAFMEQCEQFLKGVFDLEKKYEAQRKALLFAPKNGYDRISAADLAAME